MTVLVGKFFIEVMERTSESERAKRKETHGQQEETNEMV